MIQPHVSFARDTNLSLHFPHRGRLEYITMVTLLLPESQLPQHKITLSSERLQAWRWSLCSAPRERSLRSAATHRTFHLGKAVETCGLSQARWGYQDLISFDSFAGPLHCDPTRIALMSSLGCIVPPNSGDLKEEVLNVCAAGKTPRP